MRAVKLALVASALAFSSYAAAEDSVLLCDGCTQEQMFDLVLPLLPTDYGGPIGLAKVGDRNTGDLFEISINLNIDPMGLPRGKFRRQIVGAQGDEFFLYSDAIRQVGNIGVLNFQINLPDTPYQTSGISIMQNGPDVPGSSWDVRTDNAARHALLNYVGNTDNWNRYDAAAYYAKMVVMQGRSLTTGQDFTLRFEARHADTTIAVINYDSSCQCLKVVETRDGAGNLTSSSSNEPIPVDFSSYEAPGAHLRPDYFRGIIELRNVGVVSVGTPIQVKTGSVVVGNLIKVAE